MTIVSYKTKILIQEEMEILLANQRRIDWSRTQHGEFAKSLLTLTRLVFRPAAFDPPDWVKYRAVASPSIDVTGRDRDGKIITKRANCITQSFKTRIPAADRFRPEDYAERIRDEILKEMEGDKKKILPGSDYFYMPFMPFTPMLMSKNDYVLAFRRAKQAFAAKGGKDG